MARDFESDFVLTVSDHDSLSEAEEEQAAYPVGAKRKRPHEDSGSQGGQSKKTKNSKPATTNEKAGRKLSYEENEEPTREEAEDDGAMDPDFEFQVEDTSTGLLEEFDAWEQTQPLRDSVTRKDRSGVDIDDLIAKRRERQSKAPAKKGAGAPKGAPNGSATGLSESGISDESEGLDGLDSEGGELQQKEPGLDSLEDDELLASDAFGMGASAEDEEDALDDEEDFNAAGSEAESVASPVAHPEDELADSASDYEEAPKELAKKKAFFAPEPKEAKGKNKNASITSSFQSMSLSRPILRGLALLNFMTPTPIQAKTIPIALLGKDIVGGAVTGSGKTAAFVIPILERLLYRPRKVPTTRVAILTPTRELAVQCVGVARRLAACTDVTFAQLVGGLSLREQEAALRARPDVVVATPGRFIDHMRNSASFTVETLEILVLDEADRMLDDGFADELNEILTTIPRARQTMLFSATMTDRVDRLIGLGMNRPARLMIDARKQTVATLVQEFVRLRPGREDKRLAYMLHLCATVYQARVIAFFRQKKAVHRARILFALLGFKAAELHGSMTQEQRLRAVEAFRAGTATHLLATDVAARGLDIKGVEAVLNAEAPQTHELYLHRVGRTARAGRIGKACTLAAEPDRRVVKAAVKTARAHGAKVVTRKVDSKDVDRWDEKIAALEDEVEAVLKEEKAEKALGRAEMEIKKGENMIVHEKDIMARPKRTWFESEADKSKAKKLGREELNGVRDGEVEKDALDKKRQQMKAKGGGKLSGKDMKRLDDSRARQGGREWKKGTKDKGAGGTKDGLRTKKGKHQVKAKDKHR